MSRRGGAPLALGDVVQRARSVVGEVERQERHEVRLYDCSSCGVEPVGPRPDVCRRCVERESEVARREDSAESMLIPPRFRWARLELRPFAPPGITRDVVHPEAVRRVREFRGSLLVMRGESGAGKSSLAAARLLAEGAGVFVRCEDIAPDAVAQDRALSLISRAQGDRVTVLDDLGKELGGAPEGGGLASYRGARTSNLFRVMHDSTGIGARRRLIIVTIGLENARIAKGLGEDILRRLTEESRDTMVLRLSGSRP